MYETMRRHGVTRHAVHERGLPFPALVEWGAVPLSAWQERPGLQCDSASKLTAGRRSGNASGSAATPLSATQPAPRLRFSLQGLAPAYAFAAWALQMLLMSLGAVVMVAKSWQLLCALRR